MAAVVTPAELLCTECARCCSRLRPPGAAVEFGATSLEGDEVKRFGCSSLAQPCRYLGADRRCTIYETRPAACVRYRCHVLEQFDAGGLTLEQARAAVQTLSR